MNLGPNKGSEKGENGKPANRGARYRKGDTPSFSILGENSKKRVSLERMGGPTGAL